MAFGKYPAHPGFGFKIDLLSLVSEPEVTQDARTGGVRSRDFGPAGDRPAVALENVHGSRNVRRDDGAVGTDAVYECRQAHGIAAITEPLREPHRGRTAERVSIKHNAGGLRIGKSTRHQFLGELHLVIFNRLDVQAWHLARAQPERHPPDNTLRSVPSLPATDDADDQGTARRQGQRRREVREHLVSAIGLER